MRQDSLNLFGTHCELYFFTAGRTGGRGWDTGYENQHTYADQQYPASNDCHSVICVHWFPPAVVGIFCQYVDWNDRIMSSTTALPSD